MQPEVRTPQQQHTHEHHATILCMQGFACCFKPTWQSSSAIWTSRQPVAEIMTICGNAENLYEEVEPVAVTDARLSDGGREFLVKFPDAEEDSWVS